VHVRQAIDGAEHLSAGFKQQWFQGASIYKPIKFS